MSGKDNEAKVDDSFGTNHSVVWCDVGKLIFGLGFELVTPDEKLPSGLTSNLFKSNSVKKNWNLFMIRIKSITFYKACELKKDHEYFCQILSKFYFFRAT